MRFNQIVETTTAGSVATVAQPMMTQTRENVNVPGLKPVQQLMKDKPKKKGPYANSINEGKVKELAMDLKELTDEEFKKKYNKTKVEIRSDMKKVNEDDLAEQDLIVIPGQGRLRRTGFVKQDLDQGEHEGHTLKNSLHTIARAASDLDKRLSVQSEFPEWVSEKIGAAKGMMVTVMDYLISSQEMQQTDQGVAEEYNQGSSEATAKQVYQYLIQKIPGFMYTAPTADVKKAISKAMSFGPQISVPDLASYAYGILKTNDLDEGEKNTSYMNKQNQDFYNKNPNFKRDDRGVKFVGNQLASIVTPTNKPGQVAKKPMTPFKTQGVEEGNRPFRGVGGAFDRGDDERHDLDPTDWYIVKDGEMFSASIYPRQVQQAIAQGFSRTRAEAKSRANSQGVAEAAKWRTHTDAHDLDTDGSYIPKGGIKSDNLAIRQKASKTQSEKDPKSMAGMFGAKYAKKHGVPTKQLMKNIPLDDKEQGVAEGSGDKKPYPNTWHDVDPKLGKQVDKMSPEEKVEKGYANPSILKKNKQQGVAEGKWDPFTGGDYGQTPRPQRVGQDSQDNDIAAPDKEKDQAEWEAMLDYYGTNALVQRALGDLYKQTHGSGYHDSVVTPERYLATIETKFGGTEKKYFPNKQAAHKYAKGRLGHVVSFEKIDNKEDTSDLITLPVMLGLGQQKKKWMLQFPDEGYAQKWEFKHKNVAKILWEVGHNLEKEVAEGKIDFAKKLQKNVDKSNKAVVKTRQDIGSRIADIGAGGKEYNVKTDAAWDAAKKKVAEGSAPKEKQKTPYRDINGPEYKAAADKQKEKMAKDKEAEPGKKLADKIDNKKK